MRWLMALWNWFDDRTGLGALIGEALFHPVPRKSGWAYVFGSATMVALTIQLVTGVLLSLTYVPSSGEAYQSLQYLTNEAPFGRLLRGMHYFGSSAMMVLMVIHMLRTFIFAAYKFPREMSWLSGVALLGLTAGMAFTGQLLRWDQDGVWGVTLAAEGAGRMPFVGPYLAQLILGGGTVGGQTLSRIFTVHVFAIPGILLAITGLHVWLVIRNGISEPPEVGRHVDPKTYRKEYKKILEEDGVPFFPVAALRDAIFGLVVVGVVVLLAWYVGPPKLGLPPDPSIVEAEPRPDWYFLWLFAAMALMPNWAEDIVMVIGPPIGGLVLLSLPFWKPGGPRHVKERPWAAALVIVGVLSVSTLLYAGAHASWSPLFETPRLAADVVGATEGPVARGAVLFHERGCENCHQVAGAGGRRGPDLTWLGDRLDAPQITLRIVNGGPNMPAYANSLSRTELDDLVAFMASRSHKGPVSPQPAAASPGH